MRKILRKIFRSRQSIGQLLFGSLGFGLGLILLLVALHLYLKIEQALSPRQAKFDYIIINKKINLTNTLFLEKTYFKPAEIEEIKKQAFVEEVGEFVANQFEVTAYSKEISLYTELFFEALPNQFIDEPINDFQWKEGAQSLPVILNQDMLDLYNFGYNLGKSANQTALPQISKNTAKLLGINIKIKGLKDEMTFRARVVGFSQRIPSILVPGNFMEWANKNIGEGKPNAPARLILKVKNAADPNVAKYIEGKNYQINEERLLASRAGGIIKIVMSVVGILGVLFIGLSIILFLLNFRAIIAEAKEEIRLLRQLGYTIGMLAILLTTK
jgi:hypothetical protein